MNRQTLQVFLLQCSKNFSIDLKTTPSNAFTGVSHTCDGQRNHPMHAFYADHFVLPLPQGHRFPMAKYAMLRDRIVGELPGVVLRQAPRPAKANWPWRMTRST